MRYFPIAFTAALLMAVAQQGASLRADGIVGFNKVTAPANSDILVSVPFSQKSVGTFAATGITGTGITVPGTLAVNAYQTVFYVRMTSGTAKGRWSTISANTASEFSLADTSFLGSVAATDTFEVIPHQTLAKVFSDDLLGIAFTASVSSSVHTMEVLLPDTTVGTDKAAAETYYYRVVAGVGAWRRFGASASANFDNTVLAPDSSFTIRNNNGTPLTYLVKGEATTNRQQTSIVRTESSQNDVATASLNAFPVSLLELNLGGTTAFKNSTSSTTHVDELLIFDNAAAGTDKAASATYYYRTVAGVSAWRLFGDAPSADHSADRIPAGAAIVLRKGSGTPASDAWTQSVK